MTILRCPLHHLGIVETSMQADLKKNHPHRHVYPQWKDETKTGLVVVVVANKREGGVHPMLLVLPTMTVVESGN